MIPAPLSRHLVHEFEALCPEFRRVGDPADRRGRCYPLPYRASPSCIATMITLIIANPPSPNDDNCPLRHTPASLTLVVCVVSAKQCRRSCEPSGNQECNEMQPIATEIKVWPLLATPEPHPSSPRRRQGMEQNGTELKVLPLLRTPESPRRSRVGGNLAFPVRPQSRETLSNRAKRGHARSK